MIRTNILTNSLIPMPGALPTPANLLASNNTATIARLIRSTEHHEPLRKEIAIIAEAFDGVVDQCQRLLFLRRTDRISCVLARKGIGDQR